MFFNLIHQRMLILLTDKYKKISRYFYWISGIFLVLVALLFLLSQMLTPWLAGYKTQLEEYASKQLGMSVSVQKIRAGWYYFEPVVHLSDIKIKKTPEDKKTIVSVKDLGVGISIFSSLWHQTIVPGVLVFSKARINMDVGLFSGKPMNFQSILGWILEREKIIFYDSCVSWTDQSNEISTVTFPNINPVHILAEQTSFKFSNIYFKLKKKNHGYHAEIDFNWKSSAIKKNEATLYASLDLYGNAENIQDYDGKFFISGEKFDLSDLEKRLSDIYDPGFYIEHGKVDAQLWGDFSHQKITDLQTRWNLTDLSVSKSQTSWIKAQDFKGNFSFFPEKTSIQFDTTNIQIKYPDFFNQVLDFSEINTELYWKKEKNKWTLDAEKINIDNNNLSFHTKANLKWQDDISNAIIQLTSQFSIKDVGKIKFYLPDNIMSKKLSSWLHQSIISGSTTGDITLNGKLQDFPFDNLPEEKGLFLVDSYWENFTLAYKPNWPNATSMKAHIIFKNRDLAGEINDGMIDQLPMKSIKAKILGMGLHKEALEVQANIQTQAEKARHFVLNSPLKEKMSSLEKMAITGPGDFDIDITIPLSPDNTDGCHVNGKIDFLNNHLVLKNWWNLGFDHFKGWLTYNQNGIVDSQLQAYLLTYPLKLRMQAMKNQPGTEVNVNGQLGVDALKKIFHVFVFDFVKGTTSYQAKLLLSALPKVNSSLTLHSNLQGIAVNFPAPYKKAAAQKKPFSLSLQFSDNSETDFAMDYSDQLSLHFGYEKSANNYRFKHGKMHLGNLESPKPLNNGFQIEGNIPKFYLKDWLPFFKALNKKNEGQKKSEMLNMLQPITLNIGMADLIYQVIHKASITFFEKNGVWMIQIKSDEITGSLKIPVAINSGISANLSYLNINSGHHKKNDQQMSSTFQPNDIPPLNVRVKNFRYQQMNLGQLTLQTQQAKNQLIINQLKLQSSANLLTLKGLWSINNQQSQTKLTGYLASGNIQQTLQDLDIPPVMQGKRGLLNFDLNWPKSIDNLNASALNGTMDIKIQNGVITHLDKSTQAKVGLGQLLNILSLQSLSQSLTLDFSNLSAKGLNFDVLKGSFSIRQGNMTTKDTALDASVADIAMIGDIDLGSRTYNLLLNVMPHTTSSLPVIATIAGGPVIGLAAFAANALINQGMKHVLVYRYKVQGPWKNPKVIELDANSRKKK